ncbi:hypothetical protein GGI22_002069 [Coemansia erecta]|nr:hypothetical protein GGI22_002069 [Coemansia erecta]
MAKTANTKVMFVPVNQDYSSGSINAFGGAGSTLGINTTMPPPQQGMLHPHSFPTSMPVPQQYENAQLIPTSSQGSVPATTNSGDGIPVSQAVKDSVIYSQLTEM